MIGYYVKYNLGNNELIVNKVELTGPIEIIEQRMVSNAPNPNPELIGGYRLAKVPTKLYSYYMGDSIVEHRVDAENLNKLIDYKYMDGILELSGLFTNLDELKSSLLSKLNKIIDEKTKEINKITKSFDLIYNLSENELDKNLIKYKSSESKIYNWMKKFEDIINLSV